MDVGNKYNLFSSEIHFCFPKLISQKLHKASLLFFVLNKLKLLEKQLIFLLVCPRKNNNKKTPKCYFRNLIYLCSNMFKSKNINLTFEIDSFRFFLYILLLCTLYQIEKDKLVIVYHSKHDRIQMLFKRTTVLNKKFCL